MDALSCSTYRTSGKLQQVAALNVEADVNGAAEGGSTNLVFEPVYDTGQGAVVSGQWQSAYDGGDAPWWSSRPIPGRTSSPPTRMRSSPAAWAPARAADSPGLVTAVDALTIGTASPSTSYDFEPNGGRLGGPSSPRPDRSGGRER